MCQWYTYTHTWTYQSVNSSNQKNKINELPPKCSYVIRRKSVNGNFMNAFEYDNSSSMNSGKTVRLLNKIHYYTIENVYRRLQVDDGAHTHFYRCHSHDIFPSLCVPIYGFLCWSFGSTYIIDIIGYRPNKCTCSTRIFPIQFLVIRARSCTLIQPK